MDHDVGSYRKVILPSPKLFARMMEDRMADDVEELCEELRGVLRNESRGLCTPEEEATTLEDSGTPWRNHGGRSAG